MTSASLKMASLSRLQACGTGSVRTSHHFLSDDDICRLRPFVVAALRGVQSLRMAEGDGGGQLGFIGVCDGKIEMLFVSQVIWAEGWEVR